MYFVFFSIFHAKRVTIKMKLISVSAKFLILSIYELCLACFTLNYSFISSAIKCVSKLTGPNYVSVLYSCVKIKLAKEIFYIIVLLMSNMLSRLEFISVIIQKTVIQLFFFVW